ncbi:hypothetical protein L1987_40852 [Smallanthus sonchifolius]|uniref:Uncharacterized protein n=1 Tax=Smallanthus sonchifolius TaxID=185202 RepID=A0ACB9GUW3_9ASTR|nr:hypothetical protein L1987_40852 [Smallanthus sonchifolius]
MMSRKGKEPVTTRDTTPEQSTSPFRPLVDDDLINMISEATAGVINHGQPIVDNDKMMRIILALQNQMNIQVEAVNLADCFDYEGFENRETVGEMPSGTKDGEGTFGGQDKDKEKKDEEENEEEKDGDEDKDDNQGDDVDKDKDNEEDQGNTGLGGSDSTDSDDGDDEELIVENPSTDQGSKHVYTTAEGHVLEDIDEGENVDDPIDVSSHVQKYDNEQTPPAEASTTRIGRTWWFKAYKPQQLKGFVCGQETRGMIQYFKSAHALQSLPRWDVRKLSELNIVNPGDHTVAYDLHSIIRSQSSLRFISFIP